MIVREVDAVAREVGAKRGLAGVVQRYAQSKRIMGEFSAKTFVDHAARRAGRLLAGEGDGAHRCGVRDGDEGYRYEKRRDDNVQSHGIFLLRYKVKPKELTVASARLTGSGTDSQRHFAGGVEVRQIPGVRAGDGEGAGGLTPVQSKRSNVRPTWLARFTSSANVSSSVPPSVTGMPGAKEIVESQASASNTIRSVPPGPIARCWSTVMGIGSRDGFVLSGVAVVIADDEQAAVVEIKATICRRAESDWWWLRPEVEIGRTTGIGAVKSAPVSVAGRTSHW